MRLILIYLTPIFFVVFWNLSVAQPLSNFDTLRDHVVKIRVSGERTGVQPGPYSKEGTGFYVSDSGFILTAGHVVSPYFDRDGPDPTGRRWKQGNPVITVITRDAPNGLSAALIYYDDQVDLGLIKTADRQGKGAFQLGSYSDLTYNQQIYALAWGQREIVVPREGTVDTTAGLNSNGRVGIYIDDVRKSDSGSPIVNADGMVISVLSQGSANSEVGRIAIPIPFATQMLARVEIKNAEEEERMARVNAVVQEMQTEVTNVTIQPIGDRNNSQLLIEFEKRLEVGHSPDEVQTEVFIGSSNNRALVRIGNLETEVLELRSGRNPKRMQATVTLFGRQIVDILQSINNNPGQSKIDPSEINKILIRLTFVWDTIYGINGVSRKMQSVRDFEIDNIANLF